MRELLLFIKKILQTQGKMNVFLSRLDHIIWLESTVNIDIRDGASALKFGLR